MTRGDGGSVAPGPGAEGRFLTTRWSEVVRAGAGSTQGREALGHLCETYWTPLYAFARRGGADRHAAEDLVQGFFEDLLRREAVRDADPERGRFRTFLLAAFKHFATKQRERARTRKRGGDRVHLSLDFERGERHYQLEPADRQTPESLYDRRWALTLLDRVLAVLEEENASRQPLFAALKSQLSGTGPRTPYQDIARDLGLSEAAVKVAAHRLRLRYRDLLRREIAQTVSDPAEVDAEIQSLIAALGS